MKITIINSSLDKKNRSFVLANYANAVLAKSSIEANVLDLRNYEIPVCDGSDYRKYEDIKSIRSIITKSDGIIISLPIYNYGANAAIKNLVEWTGRAWEGKTVAFMCNAGGQKSYMSVLALANSLMLNFRCLILPRFVYALGNAFDEKTTNLVSEEIKDRIDQLCQQLVKIAGALKE